MRKKEKYIAAWISGIALWACIPFYGSAADADWQEETYAVTETTYVDEKGEEKTIYWTDNIIPPKMDPNASDSDFKKDEIKLPGAVYVDYIAPYVSGKGWYDVNKSADQTLDASLCFSAAASNMLHWWLDQNENYIEQYLSMHPDDPKADVIKELMDSPKDQQNSEIYARFVRQFAGRQTGFWPDLLQDQFINGYTPKENGGVTVPEHEGKDLIQKGPDSRGGFFYNVFGPDILTRRRYYDYVSAYQDLSKDLKTFIGQGDIVTLTYNMGSKAHIVTLWGAEYDTVGNLCGVYYTDSDDDPGYGMHRYRVINRNGAPYVTTDTRDNGSGSRVTCLTTLSTGKDTWEKITSQSKTEIELVWGNTEFVYNGMPQKPELTTWSIAAGDDVTLSVEGEAVEAGVHTASAKLDGTSKDKYTLPADYTKNFTILQSGTVFFGGIKVYCGDEEADTFEYGDTLTVKVSPRATGAAPSVSSEPLPAAVPVNGEMSLYEGGHLLAGPVSSDGSGLYAMSCIVSSEKFGTGSHTLTVKFHGDSNMADYEETVTITIPGTSDEYTPVAEVPPTCETPGKKAHFIDSHGKLYIEENGVKREVTEEELVISEIGHSPGLWVQKEDHHFHECLNGCGAHLDEAACSGGTATVTERAVCEICGNPYGDKLESPGEPSEKYEIISGADSIYTDSSDGQLIFKANGDFSKFTGIKIDGGIVDPGDYTAVSGSTIITLKAEYLNTLSVGSHTLKIEYTDGSVSCAFKIADASQTPPEIDEPEIGGPETDLPQTNLPEIDSPQTNHPETGLPQTDLSETDIPGTSGENRDKNLSGSEDRAEGKAVKTGDDSAYMIWIFVLLLSGSSLLGMIYSVDSE